MVGILVSFWDGPFLGAMLVLGSVPIILFEIKRTSPRSNVIFEIGDSEKNFRVFFCRS